MAFFFGLLHSLWPPSFSFPNVKTIVILFGSQSCGQVILAGLSFVLFSVLLEVFMWLQQFTSLIRIKWSKKASLKCLKIDSSFCLATCLQQTSQCFFALLLISKSNKQKGQPYCTSTLSLLGHFSYNPIGRSKSHG